MKREAHLLIGSFSEHATRKWRRISLRGAISIITALLLIMPIAELFGTGVLLATSPAFAKKNGAGVKGGGGGKNKENGGGKAGRNKADDGDTDDGATNDNPGEDPAAAGDFHDEGFASRKDAGDGIRLGGNRDFNDRSHAGKFGDRAGDDDKGDIKLFKDNFHDDVGIKDKIDLNFLKKSLGNAEDYVKPSPADASDKGGRISEGEGRAADTGRSAGRDKSADKDDHTLRAKDIGLNDKLDLKDQKGGADTEEYVKFLNADAFKKNAHSSAEERQAPAKDVTNGTEKAGKNDGPAVQALKEQTGELKAAITDLKDERKGATKAEKTEIKEEIKGLKSELKETKAALRAAKGEQPELGGETSAARNGSGDAGLQNITLGSYASREVLALGLSPIGSERVRALGFQVSDSALEYGGTTIRTLFVPERMDALQAIRLLRQELPSDSFHLNRLYRPFSPATSDDIGKELRLDLGQGGKNCMGDKCYGKNAIHWKADLTKCSRDVSIGMIDTDIDFKHPTFAGRNIQHKAFLSEGKKASPNWHGTGILALLAGRPDSGTPGLIPDARFVVANSFFADDNGEAITDTVSLLRSLEWMGTSGVKVVNMSFAGPDDALVQGRIQTLRARGVAFTAAAGNDGPAASPSYPAAYPEVVAVTAVTKDLRIYPSANRGEYIDLAAPGVGIWTALPEGREGYRTGTSFATPYATAVLALQRSAVMSEPEEQLLDNLKTVPLGTGQRNEVYGRGLLQAPSECPGSGAIASSKPSSPAH